MSDREPKGHGLENLIEGDPSKGAESVVIEDLISTGGSSLKAVEALRKAGCEVLGMVAIFTYGFPKAEESFLAAGCTLYTFSNYNALIELAIESGYIKSDMLATLQQWRQSPETWNAGTIQYIFLKINIRNMLTIESKTGIAKGSQETVFNYISDFRNFSACCRRTD